MKTECVRELDVLDALAAQRWPVRCDEDLRTHVAACAVCADLVEVAATLLDDQETAWYEAHVPPSGVVWWRAQVRAREDAARAAARPIAFIQGIAASCAVWLVVVVLRAWPAAALPDWRGWLYGLIPSVTTNLRDLSAIAAALPSGALVVLALTAWVLVAAPMAIYFAGGDE